MAAKHPVTSMTIEPMPSKPSSEEIVPPTPSGYNDGTNRISAEDNATPGTKARPAVEHGETRAPDKNKLISLKYGGKVPKTGPYLLHKGEQVTPANKENKMADKKTASKKPEAKKTDSAMDGLGKPSGEAKARVKKAIHMHIEPTDNKGFIVKHVNHENGMPTGKTKSHVFNKASEMHKHVAKTFPAPAAELAADAGGAAGAPPAPGGAPAPAPVAPPAPAVGGAPSPAVA